MRGKEEEEEEQGIGLRRKETGWASLTPSHHTHTLRTQTLDPNLLHHLTTHTHSVHLHCSLISNVAITLCPLRSPPPPPPPPPSSSSSLYCVIYCSSNCSFTAAALNGFGSFTVAALKEQTNTRLELPGSLTRPSAPTCPQFVTRKFARVRARYIPCPQNWHAVMHSLVPYVGQGTQTPAVTKPSSVSSRPTSHLSGGGVSES